MICQLNCYYEFNDILESVLNNKVLIFLYLHQRVKMFFFSLIFFVFYFDWFQVESHKICNAIDFSSLFDGNKILVAMHNFNLIM